MGDVERVGGKNASLGEMISHLAGAGVSVPGGFATTARCVSRFSQPERSRCTGFTTSSISSMSMMSRSWLLSVKKFAAASSKRRCCPSSKKPSPRPSQNYPQKTPISQSPYARQPPPKIYPMPRSRASRKRFSIFAGSTIFCIAVKEVFASLFNDRAIAYRVHKGFEHKIVALSAGVQRMVRSETGAAGVMFTLDTESGFDKVVFITGVVRSRRNRRAGCGQSR